MTVSMLSVQLGSASHFASVFPVNGKAPNMIKSQELAALMFADCLIQKTPNLFQETGSGIKALLRRTSSQPQTGKCDAIVVLTSDALSLPIADCKIPEFVTVPQDDSRRLFPQPQEEDESDGQVLLLPSSRLAALSRLDEEQPVYSAGTTNEPVNLGN
ncbi:hypothetical protein DFS33DRAFT_1352723 [Desarmillaria ectypa]|nr:hypothetical protein DFS33DRAFT_1352723 [Desarmillaria ectypa]